ncbi:hypothetical protein LXL04_015727 [Taraxacum kok-saghyz]
MSTQSSFPTAFSVFLFLSCGSDRFSSSGFSSSTLICFLPSSLRTLLGKILLGFSGFGEIGDGGFALEERDDELFLRKKVESCANEMEIAMVVAQIGSSRQFNFELMWISLFQRRAAVKNTGSVSTAADFSYLDTLFDLTVEGRKHPLTNPEIFTLCSKFLNGGTEITGMTIEWAIASLFETEVFFYGFIEWNKGYGGLNSCDCWVEQ